MQNRIRFLFYCHISSSRGLQNKISNQLIIFIFIFFCELRITHSFSVSQFKNLILIFVVRKHTYDQTVSQRNADLELGRTVFRGRREQPNSCCMLDTIFNKSGCNLQLQVNEKKNKMRKHVRKPKKQQQVNRKIRKERKKKRPSASTSYSSGQGLRMLMKQNAIPHSSSSLQPN